MTDGPEMTDDGWTMIDGPSPATIDGPADLPHAQPIQESAVCSSNELVGFNALRPLGMVRGVTVRSRNIGVSIGAGLQSLVGGEIGSMTTLCESARAEACTRMLTQAAELGANGVVAIRYDTNAIAPGITEVIAYGMAVSDRQNSVRDREASEPDGVRSACVCTSNELPFYRVQRSLGVVCGLTVRSRNIFASIGAGLNSLVGGEISAYTRMCEEARQEAYARMVAAAVERGADGILAMRYDTNEISDGITEVLAFGTAVSSSLETATVSALTAEHGSVSSTVSAPTAEPEQRDSFCLFACAGRGTQRLVDPALPTNMVTTSNILPGFAARRSLGVVQGLTVRSSSIVGSIGAGLKSIVGGEIRTWTNLCEESRARAFNLMLESAAQKGAKAVVAVRYDSNQMNEGIVEVIAYGTAVSDDAVDATAVDNGAEFPVSTDLSIPGQNVQKSLGTVRGISVHSTNFIWQLGAGLKTIVGGEIGNYTAMCESAREEAYQRLVQNARDAGATGIIAMRYDSNEFAKGVIEVVAYGSAVSTCDVQSTSESFEQGITTTANSILGFSPQRSLGVVRGITVRSCNIGRNIGAGLWATFVSGEISTWTEVCEAAREEAHQRMLDHARGLGGQAVVALRYEANNIAGGITEVFAYGTAIA